MGPTVRTILTTALAISVLMEGPAWMELTPTTASVLQSGLVRDLCNCLFVCLFKSDTVCKINVVFYFKKPQKTLQFVLNKTYHALQVFTS